MAEEYDIHRNPDDYKPTHHIRTWRLVINSNFKIKINIMINVDIKININLTQERAFQHQQQQEYQQQHQHWGHGIRLLDINSKINQS